MINAINKSIEGLFLNKSFSEICSKYESDADCNYSSEELYFIAVSYFKSNNFRSAQRIIENIDGVMSQNEDYLNLAGVIYRRLGNTDKALDYLKRGLAINPSSPYLLNNVANIYLDLDRLDEAQKILNALILNYPDFADVKMNIERLNILLENNKIEHEKKTTQKKSNAKEHDPLMLAFEPTEIIENLKRFKIAKKGKNVESSLEKISSSLNELDQKASKGAESDQINLSEKLNKEGFPVQSIENSNKLYSGSGEKRVQINKNISDSYLTLKRFAESEIYLLHSILGMQETTTCESYLNLATFSIIRNDFVLAEHYISKAKQLDPSHPNINSVIKSLENQKQNNSLINFNANWLKDYEALKEA